MHLGTKIVHEAPPAPSQVEKCLQSLYFGEINHKRETIRERTKGTCNWILKHHLYIQWIGSLSGMLWIRGAPGVGKSTVMNYVMSQSEGEKKDPDLEGRPFPLISLIHLFRWDGARLERSLEGLCRSLLHQLLLRFPDRLTALRESFAIKSRGSGFSNEKIQWGASKLFQLLEESIQDAVHVANIRIFIDGIDECDENDAELAINMFQCIVKNHGKKERSHDTCQLVVCFGCRNDTLIVYDGDATIDVQQQNRDDIRRHTLTILSQASLPLDKLQRECLATAVENLANGLFVWVALILPQTIKKLRLGIPLEHVISELKELPSELNALYRTILERLRDSSATQSLKLFQWLCFWEMPAEDLYLKYGKSLVDRTIDFNTEITGIETKSYVEYEQTDESKFNFDLETMRIFMNVNLVDLSDPTTKSSVCPTQIFPGTMEKQLQILSGGLGCLNETGGVGLIHLSIKRYMIEEGFSILDQCLKSTQAVLATSHNRLGEACLASLSAYTAGPDICHRRGHIKEPYLYRWKTDNHLLVDVKGRTGSAWRNVTKYALTHAFGHASKAEQAGHPQDGFFARLHPLNDRESVWATLLHKEFPEFIDLWYRPSEQEQIEAVPVHDADVTLVFCPKSAEKTIYLSPGKSIFLILSAEYNVPGLLSLLVREELDKLPRPLPIAGTARSAFLKVTAYPCKDNTELLARKLVKMLDKAASTGRVGIIEVLLANGCAVQPRAYGDSPLNTAAWNDHIPAMKLLLKHGASVDFRRKDDRTILSWCIAQGDKGYATCRTLLESGADPNAKDSTGWTPLHWAVRFSRPDLIRLLLQYGADVNIRQIRRVPFTPMQGLAVEIMTPTETPLEQAVQEVDCDCHVVQTLLEAGADRGPVNGEGIPRVEQYVLERLEKMQRCQPEFLLKYVQNGGERPLQRPDQGKEFEAILSLLSSYSSRKNVPRPSRARSCTPLKIFCLPRRNPQRPRARSCPAKLPTSFPNVVPLHYFSPPRHHVGVVLKHKIFAFLSLALKIFAILALMFPFRVRFRIETRGAKPSANTWGHSQTCSWDGT